MRTKFGDYIHIIENEKNYGFCEGNNIAIRWLLDNSKPDYLLLLNNDTVVDCEFLTEMVNVIESNDKIGIAGPKVYYYSNPKKLQFTMAKVELGKGRVVHVGAGEIDFGQYNNVEETDYCPGSCFLIKREVIPRIGMLDASYVAYWEETDYCQRAKGEGFQLIYCPQAKVWHKVSSSSKKIGGFYEYYMTRNRFRFTKKYATRRQFTSFLLWFFLWDFWFYSGIYLLYHRNIKALWHFYRGVKDGLAETCYLKERSK
ncbi:MAG: hypothetical protein DDT40_00676 [candidate division WS2 bacterium]|nr:hypothetical protein [Candidatus Psychracetigena formicireducens]